MKERGNRKIRTGRVVSTAMDKTGILLIETQFSHPLYGKIVKRSKRLKFHDEKNECQVGDKVKVIETRPLSREKRWRLHEVMERK